jgi:putative phosphoesterase
MKIGLLSDTHNHLTNLQKALATFQLENITHLVHCGDLTAPETAAALGGFQVIHVVGNGDFPSGEIRRILLDLNPLNSSGIQYTGEFEGVPIAAVHGHQPHQVDSLVASGQYRYIFTGHSHRKSDKTRGSTRILNPGALGGLKSEEWSACIFDLGIGQARFFTI